ncbi:Gfo/Idh/MocA family protein [Streptomyces coryli]|nr:Gfo/Idh/MocA family oxidoreductase [Streptomyces coryli]
MTIPVVLAGARGHGAWHLRNIRRLAGDGLVRLAGICELDPLTAAELDGFGAAEDAPEDAPEQSADFAGLLERTGARIAVVCTPIPTHRELAEAAAARGVHLLLEKPPAPSYGEYQRLQQAAAEADIACQIGFQSLGSHAIPAIRGLIAGGAIGEVRGLGAAGAWARDEAYYRRAPWAGRRRLDDGRDVVDGVLTNPLAHALATALAVDGSTGYGDMASIEPELFRANDIEADDTSCVRVTTTAGRQITVAATLCAERPDEPYVMVHGSTGRITFWYKQDRVLVQRADAPPEDTVYGRTDLLENLVQHLTRGAGLLVPAAATAAFMRCLEAVRTAPDPRPLPRTAWRTVPGEAAPRRVVRGIDGLVAAAAETLSLYSELGADWARSEEAAAR